MALSAFLLVTAILPGCYGQAPLAEPLPDNLPTISVVAIKVDKGNFDGDMVATALNEYVAPLIGARVELRYVEVELYNQTFSKYSATNSMPDVLMMTSSQLATQLRREGQLKPLGALLEEYGAAITQTIGDELLAAHTYGGEVYAVASMMNRSYCLCFEYRKNIADSYSLDMSSVSTLEDLTAVLLELKQKSDDVVPISEYSIVSWDPLSDSLGVLMDNGQSTQVVNLYETEEYWDIFRYVNRWRQEGLLLDRDYGLTSINSFVRSPEFFGKICTFGPGLPYVDSTDAGEPIECVILGEPFIIIDRNRRGSWGISAGSQHPEESMKFINLLYTDPYVVNLLIYGIEGVHYEVVDAVNGVIDFPEGVAVESSGYSQFRGYFFGNQFIGHIWHGWPYDLWDQIRVFDAEAARSYAYGFTYDPAPVAEQVRACREVVSEYTPMLEGGYGDAVELLSGLCAALKQAGIDEIVAGKQAQLDSWVEAGKPQ